MRRIIVFFLVVVAIILLLLLLARCGERRDCREDGKARKCEARLVIGTVGVSVWQGGTVALAVPVENRGGRGAGNVTVTALTLGTGARTDPTSLPVALGEIAPNGRGVVQASFTSLAVPNSYLLTVRGSYLDHGHTKKFKKTVTVPLKANVDGVISTVSGVLTKQHTSGSPLPPVPIKPEVEDNNQVGPPLPKGPRLTPFTIAPSNTPVIKAPPAGGSAGGITFQRDTGANNGINNAPPDPDAMSASAASLVMQTDNVVMNYSVDDGKTFTTVDPTTIFPSSDGGMCCDQVVIYDKAHDLVFWLQQYNAAKPAGSTNRLRIAWASPASIKANVNAWTYVDLTQPGFSSGGGLDYPDLAVSGGFLYVSIDGTDTANATSGLIVARLSLADIVGGGGNVNFSYLGPNQSGDMARAHGSHLSQNSGDGAYWAGGVDGSHMEVFHWADSAGTVPTHQATINSWCSATADYANLPPDKMQWPDTGHLGGAGNIVGSYAQAGGRRRARPGLVRLGRGGRQRLGMQPNWAVPPLRQDRGDRRHHTGLSGRVSHLELGLRLQLSGAEHGSFRQHWSFGRVRRAEQLSIDHGRLPRRLRGLFHGGEHGLAEVLYHRQQ